MHRWSDTRENGRVLATHQAIDREKPKADFRTDELGSWVDERKEKRREKVRERKGIERINAADKARVLSPLGCYRGLLGTRSHPSE